MEKKQMIVFAVILAGSVVGASLITGFATQALLTADGESRLLPLAPAPAASITIEDTITCKTVEIHVHEIQGMMIAHPWMLEEITVEIGGIARNIVGINPLHLFDAHGFWDAMDVSIKATGGDSASINSTDLILRDSKFFSDALGDPVIIGIVADGEWLADSSIQEIANFGNFSIFGNTRSSAQRVKDVASLEITGHWHVAVKVDGVTEFYIGRSNITTNQLTESYAYYDNNTGRGWNNTYTGRNVADIVAQTSAAGLPYNLSFIAADGWGANRQYNETDVENGLSPDSQAEIGDPAELLPTNGQLVSLYHSIAPGEEFPTLNTFYDGGPYRTVIPGQTRNRYLKMVVEIAIST